MNLRNRFSNRPFGVKRFQTIHHHSVDVTSRARASLRNQHQGSSIMGFEDEMEQSEKRPCRQTYGRSKQTDGLISSIVPRGTSFHRSVELEVPPIVPGRPSCHCELSSPTELGAVNPYAVHDPTEHSLDRLPCARTTCQAAREQAP